MKRGFVIGLIAILALFIGALGLGCTVDFGSSDSTDGSTDGLAVDSAGCVDKDGDGYGNGCWLGPDCDDNAPGVLGDCAINGCPEGWIFIPAGTFSMGCSQGQPCWEGEGAESPSHEVTLPAFCLNQNEITVAEYRKCRKAGVCEGIPGDDLQDTFCNWSALSADKESHPINCIGWEDARSFCTDWLGGDLLSEAEWEKASRGDEGRVYPWGDSPEPSCELCNFDVNGGDAAGTKGCGEVLEGPGTWEAVVPSSGSMGASPYGVLDMAGNVYEWVLDCYDPNFYAGCAGGCESPVNDCQGTGTTQRVIRGGAFSSTNPSYLRAVWRGSLSPDDKVSAVGFRCRHPVR